MKIVDIETIVVGAPWRELTFVELRTDDGLTGVGEVRMVNKTDTLVAAISELGQRHVIGSDPFDLHRLAWLVQRFDYGRPDEVAQSALAAFDVACWDLIGQSLGVPVWKLLGGLVRERTPAYANGWYQTERDPEMIAERSRLVVARGYRALKLDPFGAGHGDLSPVERRKSIAIVEAVREAVGSDVEIFVEMHGRFTPAAASRLARDLEPFDPAWFEEPIAPENPVALKSVKAATIVPIAAGERLHTLHDLREFFDHGVLDIVQVDLTHFGGLTPMRTLATWADLHCLQLAPHNVCGPVGTAANVHLAVATPNHRVLEHFNDFADPWVSELVDLAPTVDASDGCFDLPAGAGLGVKLNRDACAEHPRTGGQIRLFQVGWEQRLGDPSEP